MCCFVYVKSTLNCRMYILHKKTEPITGRLLWFPSYSQATQPFKFHTKIKIKSSNTTNKFIGETGSKKTQTQTWKRLSRRKGFMKIRNSKEMSERCDF